MAFMPLDIAACIVIRRLTPRPIAVVVQCGKLIWQACQLNSLEASCRIWTLQLKRDVASIVYSHFGFLGVVFLQQT